MSGRRDIVALTHRQGSQRLIGLQFTLTSTEGPVAQSDYDPFFKDTSKIINANISVSSLSRSITTAQIELYDQEQENTPVHQISDNMHVVANRICVIPVDKELVILHGSLQLLDRKQAEGLHRPIDTFFRSLAEVQGNKGKSMKNERKTVPASKEKYLRLDGSTIQWDVSIAPIVYKGKQSAVIYAGVHSWEAS